MGERRDGAGAGVDASPVGFAATAVAEGVERRCVWTTRGSGKSQFAFDSRFGCESSAVRIRLRYGYESSAVRIRIDYGDDLSAVRIRIDYEDELLPVRV